MTIAITGATGPFGRHVVETLLAQGVDPTQIVAGGRRIAGLADLAERGVRVVPLDYDAPDTLTAALAGADQLLLVSGSEVGRRVPQHTAVIEAAVAAGVQRVVYTSGPHAATSTVFLMAEHRATEGVIAASGLPSTILRNGWYTENYASSIGQARTSGMIIASVGDGRVASASRNDFAEAAAVVLTTDGHEGRVYELGGDVAWDFPELAATVTDLIGREVVFHNVTPEEHLDLLTGAGLDGATAQFVVALDQATKDGFLAETSGDLARLLGRPTTPLRDGLATLV